MVASMSALVTCDFISWQHRKRRPWLALSGDSSGLLLLPEQLLQSQSHVALFDLGSILLLWLPWCLCMSHVTSKEVSSCLCTMIDSAYVNVQAAVDNYALGLSASLDTSLGPLPWARTRRARAQLPASPGRNGAACFQQSATSTTASLTLSGQCWWVSCLILHRKEAREFQGLVSRPIQTASAHVAYLSTSMS